MCYIFDFQNVETDMTTLNVTNGQPWDAASATPTRA